MTEDGLDGLSIKETLKKLNSSPSGLSEADAEKRLAEEGFNEIIEKKQNPVSIFLKKFYGPVPLLLVLIILLSYALGNFNDMYVIFALLLVNSVVGFYEEYRADYAIEMLKERLGSFARVMRSGTWKKIQAKMLVRGDIVRIRFGDILPADVMVVDCDYLEIDESVITGESLPVLKKSGSTCYQGSAVKAGEATCVAMRTGAGTLYGKTAGMVQSAKPKRHLQAAILNMIKYLVLADIAVIALLFGYGTFILHSSPLEMLPFLLIVFLASVPVTLPTAFTVSMALGTEKLADKSILVSKLDAIEDTATMSVLCMDKTGTLTKNQITVKEIKAFGYSEAAVARYAAEASRSEDKDPIDNALLNYAEKMHIKRGRQVSFVPFSTATKSTEAVVLENGSRYTVIKGGVDVILPRCHLHGRQKDHVLDAVNEYARQGFRSLAVAFGKKGKPRLVGIIALYDEPRNDAKQLIMELHGLGVETKMLTGDNRAVAEEISGELGLGEHIVDFGKSGSLPEEKLFRIIKRADGFSNIYPKDKYTIVKAMQDSRKITGMTGDGINDAPALRQAEVGIAVSNATDVAKSAAALVITKDGIDVIIEAVKESRRIFQRMLTYAMTKISRVVQIVVFVAVLFVGLHGFIAITPFLLVLLFFTNDISNIAIATDNATYSQKPEVWNVRGMVYLAGAIGAIMAVQALLLYPIGKSLGLSVAEFQTSAFLLLNISDKFTIFNVRERKFFWKSVPSTTLLFVSGLGISAGIIISYFGIFVSRISLGMIGIIILLSVAFFLLVDAVKALLFRRFGMV